MLLLLLKMKVEKRCLSFQPQLMITDDSLQKLSRSITPRWSYGNTTRRCCSRCRARTMSRVWGRHAPTRSLWKLARVWKVKSRWNTKFSRIENLWPRDGSCPLPLRSKRIFNKCFQIVKTQKISSGALLVYVDHRLLRTKFLPLFVQRRWRKVGITFGRLMKFSRCSSLKEKYRPRSAAMILSGETAAKWIGCVAGR